MIWALVKRDIEKQFTGTKLGYLWVLLEPIIMMSTLALIIGIGFKKSVTLEIPFVAYMFPGVIAYYFISDAINASVNAFRQMAFLLKKNDFPVHLIPWIKIFSALAFHLIYCFFVIAVIAVIDYSLLVNIWLYPLALLVVLAYWSPFIVMISYLSVYYRDIKNLSGIVLRLMFWFTPIFWVLQSFSDTPMVFISNFNPLYFTVKLYRFVFADMQLSFNMYEIVFNSLFFITNLMLSILFSKKLSKKILEIL